MDNLWMHLRFGLFEHERDLIEQLQPLFAQPFAMRFACWLNFSLNPVKRAVERVIASGKVAEVRIAQTQRTHRIGIARELLIERDRHFSLQYGRVRKGSFWEANPASNAIRKRKSRRGL
jgi:hypothetical protein